MASKWSMAAKPPAASATKATPHKPKRKKQGGAGKFALAVPDTVHVRGVVTKIFTSAERFEVTNSAGLRTIFRGPLLADAFGFGLVVIDLHGARCQLKSREFSNDYFVRGPIAYMEALPTYECLSSFCNLVAQAVSFGRSPKETEKKKSKLRAVAGGAANTATRDAHESSQTTAGTGVVSKQGNIRKAQAAKPISTLEKQKDTLLLNPSGLARALLKLILLGAETVTGKSTPFASTKRTTSTATTQKMNRWKSAKHSVDLPQKNQKTQDPACAFRPLRVASHPRYFDMITGPPDPRVSQSSTRRPTNAPAPTSQKKWSATGKATPIGTGLASMTSPVPLLKIFLHVATTQGEGGYRTYPWARDILESSLLVAYWTSQFHPLLLHLFPAAKLSQMSFSLRNDLHTSLLMSHSTMSFMLPSTRTLPLSKGRVLPPGFTLPPSASSKPKLPDIAPTWTTLRDGSAAPVQVTTPCVVVKECQRDRNVLLSRNRQVLSLLDVVKLNFHSDPKPPGKKVPGKSPEAVTSASAFSSMLADWDAQGPAVPSKQQPSTIAGSLSSWRAYDANNGQSPHATVGTQPTSSAPKVHHDLGVPAFVFTRLDESYMRASLFLAVFMYVREEIDSRA